MHWRILTLATALFIGSSPTVSGQSSSNGGTAPASTIEQLLARVPIGATWESLPQDLQIELRNRATLLLFRDRQSWGLPGLQQKEDLLFSAPTSAMKENIDRILSVTYASELPGGFIMARDIQNTDLRRLLIRIYLAITDDRGFMLTNHPDFHGWNGMPVKELQLLDHEHFKTMAAWRRETEDGLKKIPDSALSELEKALRQKSYFLTRAGKHFDRPAIAVNGSIGYFVLYAIPTERRPFSNDAELLDYYNASMFSEFREVNVGTLDAFNYDFESEFDPTQLKKQGMSDALASNILKLGALFRSRVQALPEKSKRCTVFSASEVEANWDSFTGQQMSNADGMETMQSYANLYASIAAQRVGAMQTVGRLTLERLFPEPSPELTLQQRQRVLDRLLQEKRPAVMMDTLISALDDATGAKTASTKVKEAIARQPTVGGYSSGQPLRDADRERILDIWNRIRTFIKREYSGFRVDIAALIPAEPIIVPMGQNQFTYAGQVTLSLETPWNLVSLSSTMMHEIKHAIDQNSHAAVEGAAWEGAAVTIERQVWPIFIDEAMAGQSTTLSVARILTEIDNVRFTATTDATLKVFLRESCRDDELDTISYAEEVVRGYGYSDKAILRLRSRRAHRSTQYLEYDYGSATYADLLSYLQNGVGPALRVDAYLLQACGTPNPKKMPSAIDDLKQCIRDRKH